MAEEEKNEKAPEGAEAPAEEAKAEEAPAEEAEPAAEADAPAKGAPAPAGDDDEEAEPTPKQVRKLARSTASGPAGPQRSDEERQAERVQKRAAASAARRRNRATRRGKRGEPRTGTPTAERVPGKQKVRQGTVVSSKADKTITVRIARASRHPSYEKVVRRSATLHAHDPENSAGEGDVVTVIESRPISRNKRWRLVDVVERAK